VTKTIRIQIDDQLSFLVETKDEPTDIYDDKGNLLTELPPGAMPTGALLDIVENIKRTVAAATTIVYKGLLSATHPDELTLEFSIALKGAAGIPVIVSNSAEGTLKISTTWKNRGKEEKEAETR